MNRSLRILTIWLGIVGLLLISIACSSESKAKSAAPETVANVAIMTLQPSSLQSYYEAVGTVRPVQTSQLAAQTAGTLVRVNVREGDRVTKGQVIAVIDDSQTRSAVEGASAGQSAAQQEIAAAEADFELAQSTQTRYQLLFEKKSVSPHEFDEVNSRLQAAKARLELARASRARSDAALAQARTIQGFTQLRAPFAGTVTAKLVESGNLASPGTPIFVVEDTSSFRLEATIDESGIRTAHLGQTVPVTLDSLGSQMLNGRVVQILPAADPASRTFIVKIELPKDAEVRSGLFGRARFPLGTRDALAVPQSALIQRGSMQAVYVLGNDQIASLRYITLGRTDQQNVEVLSGLAAGERIVTQAGSRELNGKKIEAR